MPDSNDRLRDCRFHTERLQIGEWHAVVADSDELVRFVTELLTPDTTTHLPPEWQGSYDLDRARGWVADMDGDASSAVMVISELAAGEPMGLMILSPQQREGHPTELHVGYVLRRSAWGQGYATEALAGLIEWCEERTSIGWLHAGVGAANDASIRLLQKAGFVEVSDIVDVSDIVEKDRLFVRKLQH